jgi:hypothetical protein
MYELSIKTGKVLRIIDDQPGITILEVKLDHGDIVPAINYPLLTGRVNPGDKVVLNSTAVELKLGTGGYYFVCSNLDQRENPELTGVKGHIMKMRYTPFQVRTLSVEEEASPFHDLINKFRDLKGEPVIIIPLHSLLAPAVIVFKTLFPEKKVVYIMTEGGSLSLDYSELVRELKENNYLDQTITVGQAFGGDLEAVNIFTALAAARDVLDADLIITGMGPGIVGTGTGLGFSGVENAFINYAVHILRGKGIIIPRISFADRRKRHFGISHHTMTLLNELIDDPVDLAFPEDKELRDILSLNNLFTCHNISFYQIEEVKEILQESGFKFDSMGRSLADDPLFFISAGLAIYKWKELKNGISRRDNSDRGDLPGKDY